MLCIPKWIKCRITITLERVSLKMDLIILVLALGGDTQHAFEFNTQLGKQAGESLITDGNRLSTWSWELISALCKVTWTTQWKGLLYGRRMRRTWSPLPPETLWTSLSFPQFLLVGWTTTKIRRPHQQLGWASTKGTEWASQWGSDRVEGPCSFLYQVFQQLFLNLIQSCQA